MNITFKGYTNENYGLKIESVAKPSRAEQKFETFEISGRAEPLYSLYDEYKPYVIPAVFVAPYKSDLSAARQWLSGGGELIFSDTPNLKYTAISCKEAKTTRQGSANTISKITVNFTVMPFAYAINNPEISIASGDVVTNSGTIFAQPIYKIVGNGTVNLYVNGETLTINNLSGGEFVIDTQRMIAYEGTTIKLNQTIGKLPFLAVGNNVISWDGDVSSLKIVKNERWL